MLVPSIATFLVTIINVGILFFVLLAVLFKPVTKFMEERSKKVENDLASAAKEKTQARMLLEQREAKLKKAALDAEGILKQARENAEKQAETILAESRLQAAQIVESGRKQLENERQAAMAIFRSEAAALVVAASQRLVKRELTRGDEASYAGLLLDELKQGN